jgi:hypothetical protein
VWSIFIFLESGIIDAPQEKTRGASFAESRRGRRCRHIAVYAGNRWKKGRVISARSVKRAFAQRLWAGIGEPPRMPLKGRQNEAYPLVEQQGMKRILVCLSMRKKRKNPIISKAWRRISNT